MTMKECTSKLQLIDVNLSMIFGILSIMFVFNLYTGRIQAQSPGLINTLTPRSWTPLTGVQEHDALTLQRWMFSSTGFPKTSCPVIIVTTYHRDNLDSLTRTLTDPFKNSFNSCFGIQMIKTYR